MDANITQIITTVIVSLFGGSGLIATLYTYKAKKTNSLYESINNVSKSIRALEDSVNSMDVKVCNLYNEVTKTNDDIELIRCEIVDLAKQSVNMDRVISNSILTIIGGLEKAHIINGTGEKARDQIMGGLESLTSYQNGLMKEIIEHE